MNRRPYMTDLTREKFEAKFADDGRWMLSVPLAGLGVWIVLIAIAVVLWRAL